jgi:hypothetical protein
LLDGAERSADRGEPVSFDPIPITPEAAKTELLHRELRMQRYREQMACQLAATKQAALDMLRYDPSIVRQTMTVRIARLLGSTNRRHSALDVRLRRGLLLPNWYAARYARQLAGQSPLAHYLGQGLAEDLAPNPFFDPVWYRARHMSPATGAKPEPAIKHYLRIGARHALAPGALFDAAAYLSDHPEIAGTPDPLYDFIVRGLLLGRHVKPVPLPLPPG